MKISKKNLVKQLLTLLVVCFSVNILIANANNNRDRQETCLVNKDAGITDDLTALDAQYNKPSKHTYKEMIAVNDGGNRFHDYTSDNSNPNRLPNPMLEITDVVRYFVQMQEDFAVTEDISQSPA